MKWKDSRKKNKVVETGSYHVQHVEWRKWESSIIVEFEIIGPESCPEIGVPVADFFSEKMGWKLAWMVGASGISIEKLPDMDTDSEEFTRLMDKMKGKRLWIFVQKVPSKKNVGQDTNIITSYDPDPNEEVEEVVEEVPDFIKKKVLGKK